MTEDVNVSCDWTQRQMAARLSGQLPADAAHQVDRHVAGCVHCQDHEAAVENAFAAAGPHLAPEVVTALVEGRLATDDAADAYTHLSVCHACVDDVRMVTAGLARVLADAPAPHASGTRGRWMWPAALGGGAVAAAALLAVLWLDVRSLEFPWRGADARANELQAAADALARQALSNDTPRANVQSIDVFPAGLVRRSGTDASTNAGSDDRTSVRMPPGSSVLVVLNSRLPDQPGSFSARVIDHMGQVRWETTALVRQTHGEFTIAFPDSALGPGAYDVEVRASGDAGPVEVYRLRVVRPVNTKPPQ